MPGQTDYRADFFDAQDALKFSIDTSPDKDVDATVPVLIMHGAIIIDQSVQVLNWVRPELANALDGLITPHGETDHVCVFTLSAEGDVLVAPLTSGVKRVEAFYVNHLGGVMQGCSFDVTHRDHDVLEVPSTGNYVLERLCYDLDSIVTLFNSTDKLRGRRKLLNP